ncbi:MAG: hypothetical protein NTV70_06295 [Acidobacteria bacterium]|nr:hypothetical protein [Acidobacteriota bacterium]
MCHFSTMMRFSTVFLFVTAASVWAGFTVPAGPWQQLPNPLAVSGERIVDANRNIAGNQTAYWNNNTADGTTCKNIGCIVTGRVASTASDPLTNAIWRDAAYIANTDGTAVTNVYFQGSVSGPAVLNGEITSLKARSWVGWYDATLPTSELTSANFGTKWGVIFKGSDSVGKQANFSPTNQFGFWYLAGFSNTDKTSTELSAALKTDTARFTQSSKNTAGAGQTTQYFTYFAENLAAVNASTLNLLISAEDTIRGDMDYNDTIFRVTFVPEPGLYGALALCLGALMAAIRRRAAR